MRRRPFLDVTKIAKHLPALCYLCNRYHYQAHAICDVCHDLMERLGTACYYCATPLPNIPPLICGACCMQYPTIDQVITHYRFTEPLRSLIHAFKYDAALYLNSFLTTLLLIAKPQDYTTQCFIPVPLHNTKLRQRGFNQAALLAMTLSRMLNIPCELEQCIKIVATAPQAGLSAKQRQTNIHNTFRVAPLRYQHITLIDDVYTTGSTANEIATLFKKQGVERVDVWCCARTCQ